MKNKKLKQEKPMFVLAEIHGNRIVHKLKIPLGGVKQFSLMKTDMKELEYKPGNLFFVNEKYREEMEKFSFVNK